MPTSLVDYPEACPFSGGGGEFEAGLHGALEEVFGESVSGMDGRVPIYGPVLEYSVPGHPDKKMYIVAIALPWCQGACYDSLKMKWGYLPHRAAHGVPEPHNEINYFNTKKTTALEFAQAVESWAEAEITGGAKRVSDRGVIRKLFGKYAAGINYPQVLAAARLAAQASAAAGAPPPTAQQL